MIGLKTRRKREAEAEAQRAEAEAERRSRWPVVNGEPVEPYELPDEDPAVTQAKLREMGAHRKRVLEMQNTLFQRALAAAVQSLKARKGRGFEWTLLRRYTLEFHRRPTGSGELFRLELYRRLRWDINIEFWRSR